MVSLARLDDQDIQGMCSKNANAAASIGRKDLARVPFIFTPVAHFLLLLKQGCLFE